MAKLTLVHKNLELLGGVHTSAEDSDSFGTVASGDGDSGGAKQSVSEGGRGLQASEELEFPALPAPGVVINQLVFVHTIAFAARNTNVSTWSEYRTGFQNVLNVQSPD